MKEAVLPRLTNTLSTEDIRRMFLMEAMFAAGEINLRSWETDRCVLGGIVPLAAGLSLPNPPALRSACFLERREAGLLNLGGPGVVAVDGVEYAMATFDALYLGRGVKSVVFASAKPTDPARYWFVSYPAHAAYPVKQVAFADVTGQRLGAHESSNERTIYKLIHPGAFPTCQLVMGFTRLEPGSVWNTLPPHTHLRRSEVYLYFNLPKDQAVFHFMGEPTLTRHLVVRDLEAVVSPPWSIHCGAGTSHYSFVWSMGGENQEFSDMDPAPLAQLS